MPGLVGRVARRWRAEGPAGLWYAVSDRLEDWRGARFDRRCGIEAGTDSEHDPPAGPHHGRYGPIAVSDFARIVRSLPMAPRELHFMDYGCGKARAVILAAEHGFASSRGVELEPALHAQALRNAASYRRVNPAAPPIELSLGDAVHAPPPPSPGLLFFYNPFDAQVMERLLGGLRGHWQRHGAAWIIAYRGAQHARLLDDADWLGPVAQRQDFSIWRTRSSYKSSPRPGPDYEI